jgi:hypothetical protein
VPPTGSLMDVVAVVADFDHDGWSDLFIAATGRFAGDDPIDPKVSELRLGPFSTRGRGQSDPPRPTITST